MINIVPLADPGPIITTGSIDRLAVEPRLTQLADLRDGGDSLRASREEARP